MCSPVADNSLVVKLMHGHRGLVCLGLAWLDFARGLARGLLEPVHHALYIYT